MQHIRWLETSLLLVFLFGFAVSAEEISIAEERKVSIGNAVTDTVTDIVSVKVTDNVTNISVIYSSTDTAAGVSTTTITPSVLPPTTDVCGLSLVSPSNPSRIRKCKCSDFDEEVDCSYLEVTELPKLISFPKSARDVSFLGNQIQNIGQDTFYNGRNVLHLDLSHNSIDFISIVAFQAFKNLRKLDLSHNKLWNMPAMSLKGLDFLRTLNLGYNGLVEISPELFAAVPNIRELDLESNPLQELETKVFEHLKFLEVLNLESTMLKVIPDHLFFFTPHLNVLYLSSNQLTSVPTDALHVLDRLKFLDLSGNPIDVINEEAFIGMRGLVTLYLNRMPLLTDIGKYAFGDLQNLQELHCSYNFLLSYIDEKAFVKKVGNRKVQLAQLFLRQNSLPSLPKNLLNWDKDTELQLSDNPLFCDCQIEWLVHLHLKNDFQKHTRCFGPSHLKNVAFNQLKDHELACGLHLSEIVLIVLACVVFILILALIVAFIVWRRNYSGYNRPYFRVSKKKNVDIDDRMDDNI